MIISDIASYPRPCLFLSQRRRSYSPISISDVSTKSSNFDSEISITAALVNLASYVPSRFVNVLQQIIVIEVKKM